MRTDQVRTPIAWYVGLAFLIIAASAWTALPSLEGERGLPTLSRPME